MAYDGFYDPALGVSRNFFNVSPDVSANLGSPIRQIYVGTGGDINVLPAANSTRVILRNVPSGSFILASVRAISNVNTTASNIVGFV